MNIAIKDYLLKENIKLVNFLLHHPKTNGCLERYHHEVHKFNFVKSKKIINYEILEDALSN